MLTCDYVVGTLEVFACKDFRSIHYMIRYSKIEDVYHLYKMKYSVNNVLFMFVEQK